ncbi:serine-rich protein [Moniliophthora roreri]|uniref:Uncharacterized protein n=1 Tax=Moniliophthora roreri TaxID=221103 RepID=A0A0W0FC25_MONRR|nr:serine-rich protein [Moniliophthora roreri]
MLAVLFVLATISLVVDTKYTFDIFAMPASNSGLEVIKQYTVARTILMFLTNVIANFITVDIILRRICSHGAVISFGEGGSR